ncbi:MAG: dihydroorotase [Rhodospirillaceae bacterium]|nr:dihydroorotase [Rhodospirillaceae bacterium]
MSGKIAYINARLLDPATGLDAIGGLLTDGETIAAIGETVPSSLPADADVIDCKGLCLAPGLVDMRVQLCEPGAEHKETIVSAGRAAVAGGVTSMVCLPNTDPVIDNDAVVEFVARRARQAGLTKVYPYGAATKGLKGEEIAEIGLLSSSGAVAFTDGERAIASAMVMNRLLSYAASFGHLIVQHPEEPTLAGGDMNAGTIAGSLGLSGISPAAEWIILERDLRLVEVTGSRYHAAHISTAESVAIIRRAKAKGLAITCDTAPPYFLLTEEAIGEFRTFAKLSPPLRKESDRAAIIEGLADGTIDCIASDHCPQDADSKRKTFHDAAFGGIGVQTLLSTALELTRMKVPLLDALATVTVNPARILKLPAGRLAVGAAADFVVFAKDIPWTVTAETLLSKSKNSPFDESTLTGKVIRTVIDGRTVFSANDEATHG